MLLLDTNVVSDLRRPQRANSDFRNWIKSASGLPLFISVITILELQYGADLKGHSDAKQGTMLSEWIEQAVVPRFSGRILSVDLAIARRTAKLHVPNRRPERDAFIAATALIHGMAIVTRNVKDFQPLGVPIVNPWEAQGR